MSAPVRRIVDLSHPIEPGMTTYPGLPAPIVTAHLSREASRGRYAEGTTFEIGRVEMVANTGTYVDAPRHRFAEGVDVAGLPLERLADLPGFESTLRPPDVRSGRSSSPAAACPDAPSSCRPAGTRTGAPSATAAVTPS